MSNTNGPITGPQKAVVGGVIGAVVSGLSTLYVALDNDIVTAQEGVGIAVSVLVALGAVFGGVYATTNKLK